VDSDKDKVGGQPQSSADARFGGVARAVPFDLVQLRYAVAAAEYGSFRRAAEALNLKQSTLSRRILLMEQRLGAALFERTRSGVRPTLAGAEFLRSARHLIQQAESMAEMVKAAGRGEAGLLTIGCYTSLSAGNLRATLIDHRLRFPAVNIRIVQDSRDRLLTGIANGTIDAAIITGERYIQDGTAMGLWSERILVALPETHLLATRDVVLWSDLKDETFLIARHDPGPDFHDVLVAKLGAPGDRPEVAEHDVSIEAIKSLVGAGFGVSLLCDACTGANYAGVVYREACDGNGPSRIGYTAHWSKDNANPALQSFLKLLRERYPPLRTGERGPDPAA
jgi:DNA-binding transcriptional LysR family regulator